MSEKIEHIGRFISENKSLLLGKYENEVYKSMRKKFSLLMVFLMMVSLTRFVRAEELTATLTAKAPMTGAIWTTDKDGNAVNLNIYDSLGDVYLNGGPHKNSGALPEGYYYFRITNPSGSIVYGTSATPVIHVNIEGVFDQLYRLLDYIDYVETLPVNNGGEYKVWICNNNGFDPSECKTDNFKVRNQEDKTYSLKVGKFYDFNTNKVWDAEEKGLANWQIKVGRFDSNNEIATESYVYTGTDGTYTLNNLPAGTYIVCESMPAPETGWRNTTDLSYIITLNESNPAEEVFFGNVKIGTINSHTIGFWSNKNGQSYITQTDLNELYLLNLVKADGSLIYNPLKPYNYTTYRSWLLSATAYNMAYMLSAQLSAMKLTVINGLAKVDGVVCLTIWDEKNSTFVKIEDLIKDANSVLSIPANRITISTSAMRTYEEDLKNLLDMANNGKNFVLPYNINMDGVNLVWPTN